MSCFFTISGMINGQMSTSTNMVGMGTQMGQPYAPSMQNQLNMSGMPAQVFSIFYFYLKLET